MDQLEAVMPYSDTIEQIQARYKVEPVDTNNLSYFGEKL
jgi:hypothetical protein